STGPDTSAVHEMVTRVLTVQLVSPEASFWQGLCFVREGKLALAQQALQAARGIDNVAAATAKAPSVPAFIDPPLYLGGVLLRHGQLALGQAQYRLEQFPAAAETFQKLLDEGAPTHDVVRWLGVTLARLKRHDEAFRHLKTAFDLEEPKDRLTAGYLALCAACGKPNRPEDKGPNVAWAVRTVRQYEGFGDREWVWLVAQVFGEALQMNMALS